MSAIPTSKRSIAADLERCSLAACKRLWRGCANGYRSTASALPGQGVTAESIRSLADLRRAAVHHQCRPARHLPSRPAAPSRWTRPCACNTSSGTTGRPKALFFSQRDVDNAAELCARSFVATGLTARDVFQNMMTYGLFTGALVAHYGAEKIGCLVIPAWPGANSEKAACTHAGLWHHGPCTLTPSFALYFADFPRWEGANARKPTPSCVGLSWAPSRGTGVFLRRDTRQNRTGLASRSSILRPVRD